ncbi:MAG: hypothetical protein WC775_01070 [Patescibacteria group bacterium]
MDYLAYIRQFRIGEITLFDTILAYVGVFLLAPLLSKLFLKIRIMIPRSSWLWLTVPISILFHVAFNQNTPFMKMFLNQNDYYAEKIAILLMLIMGLRGIKIIKGHKGR